jgi:hypothetical protein
VSHLATQRLALQDRTTAPFGMRRKKFVNGRLIRLIEALILILEAFYYA